MSAPRALLVAGALILLALPQGARAQNPDTPTARTRAQRTQDPRLASGLVSSVDLDGDRGLTQDPADLLASVPGVHVQRQSSQGQGAYLRIRGGTPRQLVVLLNGLRISAPAGLGFDLGALSTAGLRGMRLYRGAAGAIFGAGALTGALELRMGPDPGVRGRAARVMGTLGSFGLAQAGAQADVVEPTHAVRVAARARRARGDFPFVDAQGTSDTRVNNDHRALQASTSARFRTPAGRVSADALFHHSAAGVAGPSEFQRAFGRARLTQSRLVTVTSWQRLNTWSGDWGALDTKLTAGGQWSGQDYLNPDAFLGGGRFEQRTNFFSAQAQAQGMWSLGGRNFLVNQLEVRREAYTAKSQGAPIQATRRTFALSISDEHVMWGGALSLVGALRAEAIDAQPTDLPALWMPAAGLIARPWGWVDARVNLARTARAPDMDELYLDIESVRGNPALAPERAWVGDVSVELRPHPSLALETVVFAQRAQEQIRFVPRSAYLVQATNLGRTDTWGVEQTIGWRPAARLNLQGTYTLTRARFDNPARSPLPNQPEHRAWARADVALGGMRWTRWAGGGEGLSAFAQWDARSTIYLDNFARLSNNPIHLVRVGVSARVGAGWLVRADLQNLFDTQTALDSFQRPLPGRTLSLALRWASPAQGSP